MQNTDFDRLQAENEGLRTRSARLETANELARRLRTPADFPVFLSEILSILQDYVACERSLVLICDDADETLDYGISSFMLPDIDQQFQLEKLRIPLTNSSEHPLVQAWLHGAHVLMTPASAIHDWAADAWLGDLIGSQQFVSMPLFSDEQLIGVLLVDNQPSALPVSQDQYERLELLAQSAVIPLTHARMHRKTKQQLADNMREMYILQQIDRELNDSINLKRVFEMTLDWVLRFTNAQAASLALYNPDTDELHFLVEYGYDQSPEQMAMRRANSGSGITQRVARSGRAEVVSDVHADPEYTMLQHKTQAQLAVPVLREERVIAVITLESRRLNGFTPTHLEFAGKLAARAGVAIDNARLYQEAILEREKLSHILNNTADVVIVIGVDERILLINQSALSATRLYPGQQYVGQTTNQVFEGTPLIEAFQKARRLGDNHTGEVKMPNDRTFHINIRRFEEIGWIVVMHDITPFKEMDRLKSELIATVSHDLKQPLSVMTGYIELMQMQQAVSERGQNAMTMIRRAMQNMRQLIDDLLDLAKIESGIKLDLQPVEIPTIVNDCVEQLRNMAYTKSMTINNNLADSLPQVVGDRMRLRQILINLIGNAVKYTPDEGQVNIWAELRSGSVRVAVQDNGLGISPVDQIHIFERFYRVRRPETDAIEGTGLGLAIVKSLVEAHSGQITVESKLGEGSTFFVSLPLAHHAD